jgi:DNA-binding PucR family transcriptional regulator
MKKKQLASKKQSLPRPRNSIPGSELIEAYHRREKELLALQETTLDLNRLRNTSEVLSAIVRRARSFVGSDICYLSAYDPDRQDFFVRAIEGAVSKLFQEVRIPRDLGSCHPIVESKSPFVTKNYREEPRFIHDPKTDAALEDEGIVSMAGVPLLLEGRVLGILYVADRHSRTYPPQEVALLLSLATHAALAMENARLFEESRAALQSLEAKTADIQAAIAVHEQLISLIAKGGGLEDLAKMMASILRGGMVVLDEEYYTACVGFDRDFTSAKQIDKLGKGHNRPQLLHALSESRTTGRSVPVALEGDEPCLAMAIVSATQLLGALVVLRNRPFSDSEVRTFERGAIVTGIVLLSLDRVARGLERDISELLNRLRNRHPEGAVALARQAQRCGMDQGQLYTLMLVDIAARTPGYSLQIISGASPTRKIIAGELEGHIALLCAPHDASLIATHVQNAIEKRMGLRANILRSANFTAAAEFPEVYAAARRCLDLMRVLGWKGMIGAEENLAVYATMFGERSREDLDAYIEGTIGPLRAHDQKRNTNLAETLLCFLDRGHNARIAAGVLHIHENTLRQRIETIDRLLGDWKIENKSFEIHAALRLHRLMTALGRMQTETTDKPLPNDARQRRATAPESLDRQKLQTEPKRRSTTSAVSRNRSLRK